MHDFVGGYMELELPHNTEGYHPEALPLNLGRNALLHLVDSLAIAELFVPKYFCSTVLDALASRKCVLHFYEVDVDFAPCIAFPHDAFILYVNYWGVCDSILSRLTQMYPNMIIDNTHAFFMKACGRASFNSARKFFGVPDGAYLYAEDAVLRAATYSRDVSCLRCDGLLKRLDGTFQSGHLSHARKENKLSGVPIRRMSQLTERLLSTIDYASVRAIRRTNFSYLHHALASKNELHFSLDSESVPINYPFLCRSDILMSALRAANIYTNTYWGRDDSVFAENSAARVFQKYLFPLPIDQRYSEKEMEVIARTICSVI